jgi:hypothetical protein
MPLPDNMALFGASGCGCHQQLFASQSGGGGFDWDPMGVTFAHDYTTDRRFDGTTVTDDFSVDLGGGFDPAEVSALGMAVFDTNGNHPEAIGDLLTNLQTLDYTVVIFWRQAELFDSGNQPLMIFNDAGDSLTTMITLDDGDAYASDAFGDFNMVGAARPFADNVLAVSFNNDGLLASLNGETAVLSGPAPDVGDAAKAFIGHDNSNTELEGWVKALIFYPATTTAATLEAYSANTPPENTVAPVITGDLSDGGTMTVTNGTWSGSPSSYEYQWYSGQVNGSGLLAGETANTLEVEAGYVGSDLFCVVYAVNSSGIRGIPVEAILPVNTVEPVASGTPEVGELLTVTNGTWNNNPTSYTYKWINDTDYIPGATASTYTVQASDIGLSVNCEVTAINNVGPAVAFSNFLGPVT